MESFRPYLIMALLGVSFLLWQAWEKDHKPLQEQAAITATETHAQATADLPDMNTIAGTPSPGTSAVNRATTAAADTWIDVETDWISARINLLGGDIQQLWLKNYDQDNDHQDQPYALFLDTSSDFFQPQSGLLSKQPAPNHHSHYQSPKTHYVLNEGQDTLSVPLSWTDEHGVQVSKTLRFHRSSYVVDVDYTVNNQSTSPWQGGMYSQFQRQRKERESAFIYTYTGGVLYSPENKYEKIKFDNMGGDDAIDRRFDHGWAGMIQHYFAAAWVPEPEQEQHYYSKDLGNDQYLFGLSSPAKLAAPGQQQHFSTRLYAGPKLQHMMKKVAEGLELTVDYGWLTFLAKPVFWTMEYIHSVVQNWGLSIIMVTMIIKLIFYKLSETSYRSMAKMRKLGPRMKKMREQYGDDRQRMSQAMMDLYKKEKVNPMGGCLPILVQIPVFISLYWVLLESVELRQAPFILWIHDLSIQDPYYVLPLLMGITMFIQQRLNPAPPDPVQAKVMMALPFIFTLFFAFFPAGLVLYWVANNSMSILQQWIITRRIERGGK